MPEKIFTIPINEAFDTKDGCPLCRMRDKLEEQTLESALGAAMMEPAIRIEMNREGFCNPHLLAMYRKKNKLALGLILESRLGELTGMLGEPAGRGKRGLFGKKEDKGDATEVLAEQAKSCYACKRIRNTEYRYCSNTAWLWESDEAFREKLKGQPWFCLTHASMLLRVAKEELKDGPYAALYEAARDKWMQRIYDSFHRVLDENQWAKYLKSGAGREQKAREKRAAKQAAIKQK